MPFVTGKNLFIYNIRVLKIIANKSNRVINDKI